LLSKRVVIFASGGGTSTENIIVKFKPDKNISVKKIYCNNADAGVLLRAKKHGVKEFVFNPNELNGDTVFNDLKTVKPDLIILAGFLKKIPEKILDYYKNKVLNIHPSLLPKYGGKGMYGLHVHREVIKNNDIFSGFTIHFVDKNYDQGEIIFQKKIKVETDNAKDLASKILKQEHKYYPLIIKKILSE